MKILGNDAVGEAFHIFEHAWHFHRSYKLLGELVALGKADVDVIAHPAMVLSSLASELYLKCILLVERGRVPKDHDLDALFRLLMPRTQMRLQEKWDSDIRRPGRQEILEKLRESGRKKLERSDLLYALKIGAKAFVELRYHYEKRDTYFLLYDFPELLFDTISELFPDWPARLQKA
jgi:HEPN domain-containing protein